MRPRIDDLQIRVTERRPRRWAWLMVLLPLVAGAQGPAPAAADPVLAASDKYTSLKQLARETDSDSLSALREMTEELDGIRLTAGGCVAEATAELQRLGRQEAAIGIQQEAGRASPEAHPDPAEGALPEDAAGAAEGDTPRSLGALKSDLASRRAALQARVANCRLLELNSEELAAELIRREQRLAASALLVRGPNVLDTLQHNLDEIQRWPVAGQALLRLVIGIEELGWLHFGGLLTVALLAALLAGYWRRQPLRIDGVPEDAPFASNLVTAVRCVLRQHAVLLLVLLGVNGYLAVLELQGTTPPQFANLSLGALLLLLLALGVRVMLDPPEPARPLLATRPGEGRVFSRLLQLLALLFLFGLLVRELRVLQVLDQSMLHLVDQLFVLLLAGNVLALLRYSGRDSQGVERFAKRGLPLLAVLAVIAATWLGYSHLARFIFWGAVGTAAGLLLVLLVTRLIEDLQDGFDAGRYAWQRAIRRAIGLSSNESVPGLGWLVLLLQIGLWGYLAVVLLKLWGLPQQAFQQGARLFGEGLEIGSVQIVPSRILWAVLTLVLLMMATRWIQARLEQRWLLRTRMERGAREAVATSFGYTAIAAAILLTLSMAGIDFSNLALIAGALSVGIGFGLQNVVNNFVSGLIMLFERPVKTGDWIVVGNTEGYVRRINIRTTTIQTFDRADVIVPNSELISNQVTNWMHSNTYGRFKVPVGVAYGSDTAKVRELLLQVAREHPQVVRGFPSWPDPWVLFLSFGDSALNFELRGIVYNIDQRLTVVSDLNFAIDRLFREHRIEIPFPQRVVHMAPGTAQSPTTPSEPSS